MNIFEDFKKYTEYNQEKSKEKVELMYEDTFFTGLKFTGFDIANF